MAINGVKLSFPSERLLLHSKRLRCASEHQRAGHETHFHHSFTAIQHFREKLFWSQTVYIHSSYIIAYAALLLYLLSLQFTLILNILIIMIAFSSPEFHFFEHHQFCQQFQQYQTPQI